MLISYGALAGLIAAVAFFVVCIIYYSCSFKNY
ncbi:hypothetical protein N581_06195 [Lactobacillus jensenii MD IIE-70(2)]|nr:hypothetical protein N581_06195 [Lactobacillus jensenii MD IIE-70(2)]